MQDFFKELIAVLGGTVGGVLIILMFAKNIIQKWCETVIETTASKQLEKYINHLSRQTKAYELILEKEFSFYEHVSEILSELIVDIQDISGYLGIDEVQSAEPNIEAFKTVFEKICKTVIAIKKESLLSEAYVPQELFLLSVNLVKNLQEDLAIIVKAAEGIIDKTDDTLIIKKVNDNQKGLLLDCAALNMAIKKRLDLLSQSD